MFFGLGVGGFSDFLQRAKFGEGAAEDEVRLGAGAVHGFLPLFGAFIDHGVGQGVGVQVFDAGETFFDEAAAAKTPGRADNLEDERLFGSIIGSEFGHEGGEGVGVGVFFSVTDEIVSGEEAEFEAVARGAGFAFFGAGARG